MGEEEEAVDEVRWRSDSCQPELARRKAGCKRRLVESRLAD